MFSLLNNGIVIKMDSDRDELEKIKKDNEVIIPSEKHHDIGVDIYNYVFSTNKELIEKGEIVLADNQIFFEEFDYIKTINFDEEKIVVDKNGKKTVVLKTNADKLLDGKIDDAEYDSMVDNYRKVDYTNNVDPLVMELLISFLSNNKDKMNQNELQMFEKIVETKKEIKQKFMKAKSVRKLKNI